jgi:hypothetical protein
LAAAFAAGGKTLLRWQRQQRKMPVNSMPDVTDEVPISHLQRCRIESRVLIPFITACREKFGDAAAEELVVTTIRRLAIEDGAR